MKYKRYLIECNKNYAARIFRCPDQIDNFDFTLHWHRDYEIIFVEKGPLKIRKLDCEIILQDGDVYFINSEELHSYSDVTKDLKFVVVNYPIKSIQPYLENPQDCVTFNIESPEIKDIIANSLLELNECKDLDGRVESLKIKAVLNNVAYYLVRDCQVQGLKFIKGSESDDFACARSAIYYMEQHYSKDIPLAEIASYVGMTPAHFSKYFKDKTEITFSKYLRRIRLDHALTDMIENNVSEKSAALNNGFPNVNSLILTCKSEYGRTPVEMKMYKKT